MTVVRDSKQVKQNVSPEIVQDSKSVTPAPTVTVSVGLDGKSYHRPAPSEPVEDMSPVPVKTATRPTVHAHHPNTTRPEQCGCGMSVKPTPPTGIQIERE